MKFYKLSPTERRKVLQEKGVDLSPITSQQLKNLNNLSENVVGSISLPLGLVENLLVNG